MRSDGQKKGGAGKLILLIIALLVIFLVTSAVLYVQNLGFPYKKGSDRYVQVTIPEGTHAAGVGDILQKDGIIRFSQEFSLFSRLKGLADKYQAGVYALSPGMSMEEIAKIISEGKINSIKVSIPEGYTVADVIEAFSEKGAVNKKKFKKAIGSKEFRKEYTFLKETPKGDNQMEGYLSPKTYEIPAGTSEEDVVRMMLDEHQKVFTKEMETRAKKLKLTQYEVITIASIIEKECGDPEDQPTVASVIYNRLDKDMALQMDSTIQYVLGLSGDRKKDLLNKDTEIESEYNTYTNKGLPKGPICSPGVSAISAALYPEKTKYMYFVLSDKLNDKMAFSVKYEDFLRDKDAYYKALEENEE